MSKVARTAAALIAALLFANPSSAGQVSSVYTKLDLKKCKLMASNPNEGGWAVFSLQGA